ncbi:hypothetical protein [Azospirillum argentinense]
MDNVWNRTGRLYGYLAVVLTGLSACGPIIALDNLRPYQEACVSPERLQNATEGSVGAQYVLRGEDLISFKVFRNSGGAPLTEPETFDTLIDVLGYKLSRPRQEQAVTVSMLQDFGDLAYPGVDTGITIRVGHHEEQLRLDKASGQSVVAGRTTASHLAGLKLTNASNHSKPSVYRLAASPLPRSVQRARPGDLVNLVRTFEFEEIDQAPVNLTQQNLLSVDPTGYLSIPPLVSSTSFPALEMETGTEEAMHMRRWQAGLDEAAFRVRVWKPDVEYAGQPSLHTVGQCLSARVGKVPAGGGGWAATCAQLGITPDKFPTDPRIRMVRNDLKLLAPQWTLVDEKGHAHPIPYEHGARLIAAVIARYPAAVGRELMADWPIAFLTVVPTRDTGLPSTENPFYCKVADGKSVEACAGVDPWLLPGDHVFVSRLRPTTLKDGGVCK